MGENWIRGDDILELVLIPLGKDRRYLFDEKLMNTVDLFRDGCGVRVVQSDPVLYIPVSHPTDKVPNTRSMETGTGVEVLHDSTYVGPQR